jgi:hypothetical protein
LRKIAIICAASALLGGIANAQDTLYVNYMNDGDAITANVFDANPYVNIDAYVGSLNGTLVESGTSYDLAYMYCVDLQGEISVPTSYDVTVSTVDDAAAWLMKNEAYPAGGLTTAQDAGLQLAIWDVTYPGVSFSNVTDQGNANSALDPTYWEGVYLAADNYGANVAWGYELDHVGSYGQNMVYVPQSDTPAPAALVPFLAGFLIRRRSR